MINLVQSDFLSFKGQNVVTPWDRLKKYIFQSYPVVELDQEMSEDEMVAKAFEYIGKDVMVWMIKPGVKLRKDFPWHYRPSDLGKNFVNDLF